MSSMRPIGAVFVRACATAMAFFVLASGNAAAVVKEAGYGITLDHGVATLRRGAETLHAAHVDRRAFEAAAATGRTLELPGTNGSQLARFARIEASNGNWSWVGHVDTALGEQSVVVTFGPDAVFGTVPQRTGKPLRIESLRGRAWLIEGEPQRVRRSGGADDAAIPRGLSKPDSIRPVPSVRTPAPITAQYVVIPYIDVLMLYTPSMVTRYGSASAVTTRLAHLAAVTNSAFYDSPTFARINVVAMLQLDYTTAGQNSALLDLITNPSSNPVKTQVDAWRNQYNADLVSVVRSYDNATQENCGLAWIGGYHNTAFDEAKGFSVVGDGASGGYYCDDLSFTHELGHNLGGHHDYATAGGDYGHYEYSRGYRQTLPDGSGFATIMAYPAANDTHLARFSNWKLNLCMANYCGDSDTATMVDTIDHTASDVSSYRGDRTWGDIGPRLSIPETGSIVEGNSGTRQMWIRASLDKSSPNPVYFEVDAFASSFGGSDIIEPVPGTVLTIPAGGLYRDFPITIIGDTVAEPDETFYVSLRNVSGAFPSSSMLATIVNDDKPNLTIADASVTEGDSGTKVMNFTVSLSSPTSGPVTFDVATITPAGTTATANVDFVPFTAHLQMPLGTTTKTFAVTIKGDTASEPNETFIASITNVVGAIATDGAARGTILNDDLPSLSINDVAMAEGNSGSKQMVFTVRASQVSAAPITFTPALNPGAGMDSTDFDFTNGPLTIAAGQLARTVPVTIKGDTLVEADEVFVVSLGNVQGAAVADGAGKGTILNDDVVVPTMGIADATVVEGDSGTTSMNFTVSLSSATTVPVTFDLATSTANGATATANTDFVPVVAHLQMPAGTTTKTFAVTIKGDTVAEADETFFVDVTNAVGATIADGTALGTIASDDATLPTLSIADVSLVEGNSGTKVAVFTAQLSKPATVPVSFVYVTYLADGATASPAHDFEHINEIHTIPVGQSALSLPVTIYGDTEPEIDEIFFVRIDSVEGATLVDGAAKGTIRNDDLPVMTIGDTAAVEGNSGNPIATFTVQLTGPAAAPITFDIGTLDSPTATAKPGTDYVAKAQTRTIPMGVSSAVFNVGLIGDTTIEPNEVFVVTLSNVSGPVVLGDGAARATILNDD